MKRLARLFIRLYPRQWQDRYGHELEALLEDTNTSARHIADVLLEALKMRIATLNTRLIATFAVTGLTIALAASYRVPNRYTSTQTLAFESLAGSSPETLHDTADRLRNKALGLASLTALIQAPNHRLYGDLLGKMPMSTIAWRMKTEDLRLEPLPPPSAGFRVSYTGASPAEAQAVVRTLAQNLADDHQNTLRQVQLLTAGNLIDQPSANKITVRSILRPLAPPTLPAEPNSPNHLATALTGLLFGLSVALAFSAIRRWPGAALKLSGATLLLAIASYVGSWYESRTVLVFDSPETRAQILSDLEGDFRHRIRMFPEGRSALTILVGDPDRFTAQRSAQALTTRLIKAIDKRYGSPENHRLYPAGHWMGIVDTPSLPVNPSGPPRGYLLLGAILSALTALIARLLDHPRTPRAMSPQPA